jgi:hypothetical protein
VLVVGTNVLLLSGKSMTGGEVVVVVKELEGWSGSEACVQTPSMLIEPGEQTSVFGNVGEVEDVVLDVMTGNMQLPRAFTP